jgi:outer membrane protein assembly factor BamB
MVPQFRSRLAVNRPNQQVQVEPTAVSPQASLAETTAMSESLGFLGSQRNGVIRERAFGISASDDEPEILWEIGIGEGWSSFAVQGDRAVTMEQREQEEWLTCYRLLDGKLLWSKRHTGRHENPLGGIGPRSTPTIAGNRVYAQSATGFLWCVDIQSGSEYWTADLLQLAGWPQLDSEAMAPWGRSGSPLVVEGLCIVPFGAPDSSTHSTARSLIAFNADDGSEVWRAGDGQISYASPSLMTLAGKRQVVSVNENTVTGHDVETGKQLWSFRWPGQTNAGANCASAIQVDDTRFLIGKGYGGGSALVQINLSEERFDANEVWASSRVLKTKFSHACVDRDVAYAISNGILEAVSINDGELIWSQPRGVRAGAGQILLVEDTIVVQNEAGGIVFVQAGTDEYAELGRLDALESKTWNVPTIAGRHLLVRNDNQAMCFLLPPR